ncbi:hypothetical protein [Achromobacter xylosoxidans]|jgi:hypothetical protein|uniref:Uncharacterized protein n=1 Tax=Alcaligenes xylosoxydans xylosoxydans TaxID=85698 RepID=A0A9X3R2S0_ALCXX|nr:hypothetical protein [Achromobacter xylosoxidans]MCZ8382931.1 hypothetical protein [Achromobacter xylosoxidans]MCZ8400607.1 hypothetical protein [Achromobacter xylosoxidans]QKQ54584.1 hypothetical protein FOC83_17295 [Achromobacter xylosoxidans]QPR96262.1 hypothetical protein I6G72_06705 [Achromobacter xylosoxidans]UON40202.1 hypothetical protein IUJ48_29220 [Achromobacter xylosoxidans]
MIYSVLVEAVGLEIEEEVLISVCGHRLLCFASYLPDRLEVGKVYQAELLPMIFDDYVVREINNADPAIVRQEDGYSYTIVGQLRAGCLHVGGLLFCDNILLSDYGFMEGKMVSWKVDRLDVSFV